MRRTCRFFSLAAVLVLLCTAAVPALGETWYPALPEEMPEIYLTTDDGSSHFAVAYTREEKLQGMIDYVDGAVTVAGGEGASLSNAKAQLKARGNWTLNYPKKSIRIKFEKKQSLLGMNGGNAYRSWVLLAEWKDLSMLHSPVAFFLARNILGADGYYCTDYRFVHLYLNGEYWGVYLLVEQQEVNPGRVDVAEGDGTGRLTGYLMEYDAYFQEEQQLPSGDPAFEVYHTGLTGEQYGYTVKSRLENNRQKAFLRSCMRLIYRTCYAAVNEGEYFTFNEKYTELVPFEGKNVEETVGRVMDIQSLVDTYILQEIVCNPDVGWSSFYMSLDLSPRADGKLTFEAPWDFDSCFGIRSGYEENQGLYARYAGNPWLQLFAGEAWFEERVKARWAQLKAAGLPEQTMAFIDELMENYGADIGRNYSRWPQRITDGNEELIEEPNSFTSQPQAVDYLRRWLQTRFDYLDSRWQ